MAQLGNGAQLGVDARLESEAFSCDAFHVRALTGREAISKLYRFEITILSDDGSELDVGKALGASATLVLSSGANVVRRIHGMIERIVDRLDPGAKTRSYVLHLVPRLARAKLVRTYEIFLNESILDIVTDKLTRIGIGDDVDRHLVARYPKVEYVVQYRETDLAFVRRRLEHLGVSFVFDQTDADRVVLVDHNQGFPLIEPMPFEPGEQHNHISSLELESDVIPASFFVRDYNYRTPHVNLTATHAIAGGLAGGFVEYGVHTKTIDETTHLAKVRAEEVAATHRVFRGKGRRAELTAGSRFRLEHHPHFDGELLVTSIKHRALYLTHGSADHEPYENTFTAIPAEVPFRPPRVTSWPRIDGVITGVVIDPEVAFATKIDGDGRYTVKFHFDSAVDKPAFSRPIRMAQAHAGAGYGMHLPIKSGTEVLVSFIDGDPDRPIIVAALPNAAQPSPVIDRNSTKHIIRTASGILIELDDG